VKNCPKGKECDVSTEEIKPNATAPEIFGNVGPKPIKQIIYPLRCLPDAKPGNSTDGFFLSDTCSLMIVIEGATKGNDGKIKYSLSLEDDLNQHQINLNHYNYVKLEQGQSKNFTLQYNHPKPNNPTLEMIFEAKYGTFEACVRVVKDEATLAGKSCDQKLTIEGSAPGIGNSFQRIFFHSDVESMRGNYHVELIGKEHSGLIFGVTEMENIEHGKNYLARELKAGVPVTDSLRTWNSTMYYSFQLNPSLNFDFVRISLTSLKGNFAFAVRNDDIPPSLDQGFWTTSDDSILISKKHPQFKSNAFYTIAVVARVKSRYIDFPGWGEFPIGEMTPKDMLSYRFQIKWTYTDKHNHLMPGIPEYGRLLQDNDCFVFEINKDWKEVLVVKNSPGHSMNLFALVAEPDKIPSADKHDFKAIGPETGFQMKKEDIDKSCAPSFNQRLHCNVYMCLYGKKHEDYMLAFTFDDTPFVLTDSRVFYGPTIKSEKVLYFTYLPSKDSPTDIEEFSGAYGASIAAALTEIPKEGQKVQFLKEMEPPTTLYSTLIHFSRAEITKLQNPVIGIAVGKSTHAKASTVADYDFTSKFSLEAGYYLKELSRGVSRITQIGKGQIAYFYFYNYDPVQDVVIGLDSLDGGDARMFLSRGKEARPRLEQHEKASTGFKSSYLVYNARDSKGHGYKSMRGYYVLGIMAVSDIKFSVSWKHKSDQLDYAFLNSKRRTVIPAGKKLYVTLGNTMGEDIILHVNSHAKPVDLYYLRMEATRSYSANELELFPGPSNHKIHSQISPRYSSASVTIPKENECHGCKYLFTFANNNTAPVDLEYIFVLSGMSNDLYPQSIHSGEVVEDFFTTHNEMRKYFVSNILRENHKLAMYLEAHVLTGGCDVQVSVDKAFSPSGVKVTKSIGLGYHFVSLNNAQNEAATSINSGRGIKLGYMYIQLKCQAKTQIKFVVVKQEAGIHLYPNVYHESFLDEQEKGGDLYVHETSGKEKTLSVSFMIDHFLEEKQAFINKTEFKKLVKVYYAKDYDKLAHLNLTTLRSTYSLFDPLNRRIIQEFKPRKGLIVIEVKPIPKNPFKYTISLNTEHVSYLPFGRYNIDYISKWEGDKVYELRSKSSGSVYFKLNQCFGRPQAFITASTNVTDKRAISLDLNENDRFVNILNQDQSGETHFVQVIKPTTLDASTEFGYLDHTKNLTVYGVEAIEKEGFHSIQLNEIKPTDEDIWINLSGDPVVYFRPLNHFDSNDYYHSIIYYVVVSRDPAIIRYYTNCEKVHLEKVLKKGYKISDAVHVFNTTVNPKPEVDKITGLHYHKVDLKLSSGNRYYLNIFAKATLKRPHTAVDYQTLATVKVEYKKIEFEYTSYFYPIEWLAATLGLFAVILGTCWVTKNKLAKHMLKLTGFKPVASSEIDDELEDYYLQVKSHFEESEKNRSSNSTNQSVLSARETRTIPKQPELPTNQEELKGQETELKDLPPAEKTTKTTTTKEVTIEPEKKDAPVIVEDDLFEGEPQEAKDDKEKTNEDI
jgi:hypothetical protein